MSKPIQFENSNVQEFLGKPPKWIVRWGISVLFGVLLFLFGTSYFVYLPDQIQVPICTMDGDSNKVMANADWYIEEIYVDDNTSVEKGEPLAKIIKVATLKDLMQVQSGIEDGTSNRLAAGVLTTDSLILASFAGRLSFTAGLHPDMHVSQGMEILEVLPSSPRFEAIIPAHYADDLNEDDGVAAIDVNGNTIKVGIRLLKKETDFALLEIIDDSGYVLKTLVLNVNRRRLFDKLFRRGVIN